MKSRLTTETQWELRAHVAQQRRKINQRVRRRDWVMVIINPAAGQTAADLKLLNRIIHQAGMEWDVQITNTFGDGKRLASRAASAGASLVAACGGDGTVMDVAAGLLGTSTPLAILPSGTGNVLAKELGIPLDLPSASALLIDPSAIRRPIDLGVTGERVFLLRLGVGLEADIVHSADRSSKDRLGPLAYITASVQAWNQAPSAHYRLDLDGQLVELDGLAVMVANAGALGVPGLWLPQRVRIDDGVLDVFVIRRGDLVELAALAATVVGSPAQASLPHWQVRQVKIDADPPHGVEADGELLGLTPVQAAVVPGALRVIVPRKSGDPVSG